MDPGLVQLFEEGAADEEVAAIVRLSPGARLPESTRQIARFGDIATVRLPRGEIPGARFDESVVSMKDPKVLAPEYTDWGNGGSEETIVADRRPRAEQATGRGVLVGVIDWGLDFAHPDFRQPNGRTRLRGLWDQGAPAGRDSPAPYGYGALHTREGIDAALRAPDPYTALGYFPSESDVGGLGAHGTHVASIAAGAGLAGGPLGVAPDADLAFVHLSTAGPGQTVELGDSAALLEAVDFILRAADDRPCAINMSMGRCGEQHDGTTLVEQGLDAALTAGPQRAIVQSTGNYFARGLHASGRLRPGETEALRWNMHAGTGVRNQLEVWYSGLDAIVAELRAPDGTLVGRLGPDERTQLVLRDTPIGVGDHRLHEPNNLDNHIVFLVTDPPVGGEWILTLIGADVVDGRFHAWIEREAKREIQSNFSGNADPRYTTGSICNGTRTIAVGAFDARSPDLVIAPFSSAGPTRDDRIKPDLVAPGVAVLAARSAPSIDEVGAPLAVTRTGTSMATPHVTGTVALMLEVAPVPLRVEELHNLLLISARKPSAPQEDSLRYGSGYLDIDAAVGAARTYERRMPPKVSASQAREDEERRVDMNGTPPPSVVWEAAATNGAGGTEQVLLDCSGRERKPSDGTPQPEPSPADPAVELVEEADEIIGMGGLPEQSPAALTAGALSQAGLGPLVAPAAASGWLAPSAIFDAYTSAQLAGVRSQLDPLFEPVGYPTQPLAQPVQVGDLLIRHVPGRADPGHAAFVAAPPVSANGGVRPPGLRLEQNWPGLYALVVEAGLEPHRVAHGFARRVADERGFVPHDSLILRPRFPTREIA
jgi:subtilisin family serine protease